jgi:hypothetical protein
MMRPKGVPLKTRVTGDGSSQSNEQLKLLFDYTKFHIGLYTTLGGALIAGLSSQFAHDSQWCRLFIGASLISLFVAGLAAGIVAASLPLSYG